MVAKIFIDGAAGTTGLEICERLAGRRDLALVQLSDAQRKDTASRREALNESDLVILFCLPDDAAREAVSLDCKQQRAGDRRLHRPSHRAGLDLRLPRTFDPRPARAHRAFAARVQSGLLSDRDSRAGAAVGARRHRCLPIFRSP